MPVVQSGGPGQADGLSVLNCESRVCTGEVKWGQALQGQVRGSEPGGLKAKAEEVAFPPPVEEEVGPIQEVFLEE